MRTLIKTLSRVLLIPPLRLLAPALEDLRRLQAFALLSSRISHSLPRSVVVLGAPEVHGTGDVRFGENVLLYRDGYLETHAGASIEIGDDVVISRGVHLVAYSGITIGEGSMIGEYSSVRDANHLRAADHVLRDGLHLSHPITIGRQVWIGRGVTVLPGISIGDYATVGANAVVTRDVPAGVTVVGVPATPIHASLDRDARRQAPSSHGS